MHTAGRAILVIMMAAGAFAGARAAAQSDAGIRATVRVHADQPGATIHRNLYGQFAEHLGTGIYGGVWVGEESDIPNSRGYRTDVVEALKALQVPVVRWPGGCFADEYHWQDGIGPADQRPARVNTTWGGVEESNAFGTHEFLDFVELIGADPYLAGNVGTGNPTEMAQWAEYITSESQSALAELRRNHGRKEPWKLPYFGIGNETWGCGGNMRAEYFADVYRQFATFLDTPEGNRAEKIASGPYGDDYHWTEIMLSHAAKFMDAYSLHYYTLPGDWEKKGPSTGFDEGDWAVTIAKALQIDEYVTKHSEVMDKYDPDKRIGLYVDEWGTWYDPEPGRNPAFLFQQNTIRDAVTAASTLHIFHRHADRVRMSLVAQMVNVLQAMILTDKEKMLRTPHLLGVRDVQGPPGRDVPARGAAVARLRAGVGQDPDGERVGDARGRRIGRAPLARQQQPVAGGDAEREAGRARAEVGCRPRADGAGNERAQHVRGAERHPAGALHRRRPQGRHAGGEAAGEVGGDRRAEVSGSAFGPPLVPPWDPFDGTFGPFAVTLGVPARFNGIRCPRLRCSPPSASARNGSSSRRCRRPTRRSLLPGGRCCCCAACCRPSSPSRWGGWSAPSSAGRTSAAR
jgi:alpha-N-arabinofuranosidase